MRNLSKKKYLFFAFIFLLKLRVFSQSTFTCSNADFEQTSPGTYTSANAIAGWTLSSQTATSCNTSSIWNAGSSEFSIVSTPIISFPIVGTIANSPLGGTVVARLNNNTANNYITKIAKTINVTTTYPGFVFAFAGYWEGGNHNCCEQSAFKVQIRNCQGVLLACPNIAIVSSSVNCNFETMTYSVTSGTKWSNWQVKYVDLSAFTGSCVILEIISSDCLLGDHVGTTFFDMNCGSYGSGNPNQYSNLTLPVTYCPGATTASIQGPIGFSTYTWSAPLGFSLSPTQINLASITINNPFPGNIYTVSITESNMGCVQTSTAALTPSSIAFTGIGASSTCSNGSSGSATVITNITNTTINYLWINSSNSVVSTNSIANNLSGGIYTIQVSVPSNSYCGTTQTTVNIGTNPNGVISMLKPFCGNTAYLFSNGGTNHQWYNGNVAISSGAGGTASNYTVNNALNNSIYRLRYISPQGCQDSIQYTLIASSPGIMSVNYPNLICPGSTNGQAIISLTQAIGAPIGYNYFIVSSVGSLTPSYSSSINPTSSNTFSLNNLSAGGTYSIEGFDGACKYSKTFTTNVLSAFNFTLSPNNVTLCTNNAIAAGISFTAAPSVGQYNYTWTPNLFLAGGNPNLQNTIIQPTAGYGNSVTIIYTVLVTPSLAYCPQSKTISISLINLANPTITPINQILCGNSGTVQIIANPIGGVFINNPNFTTTPISNSSGVLTPSNAMHGANSFAYSIQQYTCNANSSMTYTVSKPQANLLGNNYACIGNSFTMQVSGANNYTWNTGSNDSIIVYTPSVSTNYTVVASNTLGNCSSNNLINITVVPLPTVTINGGTNICVGDQFTLNAQGANTYSWNNGSTNSNINLVAINSSNYSVTGITNFGCKNSASISVQVNPNPTLITSGNVETCFGDLTKLKAFGANTYSWSNGIISDSIFVNPQQNTSYIVKGFTKYGCTNQCTVNVKVRPLPMLTLKAKTKICLGEVDTMIAKGANNYKWNDGLVDSILIVNLNASKNFTVTGYSSFNCTVAIPFSVQVNPIPNIAIAGKTVACIGDSITLKASGANSYHWTTGSVDSIIKVSPSVEMYFSVVGANANECAVEKLILISVANCDSLNNLNLRSVQIYPNPTEGVFFVNSDLPISAEIYFPWGQLMQKEDFIEGIHFLNFSAYSDGVYIVRINYNKETKIFKLLKQGGK